jgi:hypothetical protein
MRKTEPAARGQTLITETGPDRSSHRLNERKSIIGKKMGGGVDNLAHSLSASSATGDYTDTRPAKPARDGHP